MLNMVPHRRSSPQLCDLQRFFLKEIDLPEQKITPISLPFYNFICYTVEMFTLYCKSTLDITLNVFLVDEHMRRYPSVVDLYRHFMGMIESWKKYGQTEEGKLFLSFLQEGRNQRKTVRLFLKLRKSLLKNINQKIMQDIKLNHEDAVTIVHTMEMLTVHQKKALIKKINDHFIAKNVKHPSSIILNAAILCQYILQEVVDQKNEDSYETNLSHKLTKILKEQSEYIQEEEEQSQKGTVSGRSINQEMDLSLLEKENSILEEDRSLVSLEKCMKELFILKEKDLEIDNRFKRISKNQ